MTYYIVQINLKDGTKGYVGIGKYQRLHLVKNKSSASKFLRFAESQVFSDYFWEKYWKRDLYETRESTEYKTKEK